MSFKPYRFGIFGVARPNTKHIFTSLYNNEKLLPAALHSFVFHSHSSQQIFAHHTNICSKACFLGAQINTWGIELGHETRNIEYHNIGISESRSASSDITISILSDPIS